MTSRRCGARYRCQNADWRLLFRARSGHHARLLSPGVYPHNLWRETALVASFALGPLQIFQQALKMFVALSLRAHLKLTQRSADVQIMVPQIGRVPGDFCHRLEDMSRRELHF
ncbi:hypothetical protein [Sinorhizobium fredii]|uniref:hypothetical protein n=1 Tax=Rhizobium fredii TaxID=380 RepID=UPI00351166A3